jgi:mono/diheme cytochrome c family protein
MSGKKIPLLFVTAMLGFAGGIAVYARGTAQALRADPSQLHEERTSALAKGKELFLARCASCHNESGDKPLKTGLPLNERRLSTDEIARAVSGRLKEKTEEERRAVTLYIATLMKTEEKAPPKP